VGEIASKGGSGEMTSEGNVLASGLQRRAGYIVCWIANSGVLSKLYLVNEFYKVP
jgi:hypothetical protein